MDAILYVRHPGQEMDLSELEDLFTTVGDVESCRLELMPETGRTTKIGIIQMASQQQAADCVERFHGQLMNGHALSVDLQMPKPVVRTAAIFGASRKTVAKKRSRKA